jgi:hypothetical protein
MGIRESMNENKGISVGITVGLIACAIGFAVWYLFLSGGSAADQPGAKAFFTSDDGKTYFLDMAEKIPPFDHNGKKAYGCSVFTNDGGKTQYVAWLYRYTDEGKKRLERMRASKGREMGPSPLECIEVKPAGTGDDGWMLTSSPKGMEIQKPTKPGNNEQVSPDFQ